MKPYETSWNPIAIRYPYKRQLGININYSRFSGAECNQKSRVKRREKIKVESLIKVEKINVEKMTNKIYYVLFNKRAGVFYQV